MHREDFTLSDYKLSLFRAEKADRPLIVFHSFSDEGEAVYQELRKQNAPECSFLSISISDWQREMSPWPAAALSKDGESFSVAQGKIADSRLSKYTSAPPEKDSPSFESAGAYHGDISLCQS